MCADPPRHASIAVCGGRATRATGTSVMGTLAPVAGTAAHCTPPPEAWRPHARARAASVLCSQLSRCGGCREAHGGAGPSQFLRKKTKTLPRGVSRRPPASDAAGGAPSAPGEGDLLRRVLTPARSAPRPHSPPARSCGLRAVRRNAVRAATPRAPHVAGADLSRKTLLCTGRP